MSLFIRVRQQQQQREIKFVNHTLKYIVRKFLYLNVQTLKYIYFIELKNASDTVNVKLIIII